MHLTTEQKAALKAHILANQDTATTFSNGDLPGTAALLSLDAAPTFIVWKSSVSIRETGQAFNGAEWASMTSANHTRLQTVAQYLMTYNPSLAGIRAMFDDIWGAGGPLTKTALLALWKRPARRVEKLFATGGNGSDATPATLVIEGAIGFEELIGL